MMRDPAIVIVLVIGVVASAVLLADGRLLLVVAGDEEREMCADDFDGFIAVAAATGRVADERKAIATDLPRMGDAGSQRRHVPVGPAHHGKTGNAARVINGTVLRLPCGRNTLEGSDAG